MREFLDRYTVTQIIAAAIIAAVLGVEGLFYVVGGWKGVLIITTTALAFGVILGIVIGANWLFEYIDDRKTREFWESVRDKEERWRP